jgi:GxxExxY protein
MEIKKNFKPQMHTDTHRLNAVTEKIIGCTYTVGNTLGCGLLEKVYENALKIELTTAGLRVEQQHPITVLYDGQNVGDYAADLLVEGEVIVEIKAVRKIEDIHLAQCLNYLRATGLKLGLLVNFGGTRVEVKRLAGVP